MKIALVHDFLFKLGGAEKLLQVLAECFPDAPIYTLIYDAKKCGKVFPKDRIITSQINHYPFAQKHPQWYLMHYPQAVERWNFDQYDLVLTSSSAFVKSIITNPKTKVITYCHRPMGYAWDWTHRYASEKNMGKLKNYLVQNRLHTLRQWDRASSGRTDFYLANSKNTQKRLEKYYRTRSELIYPPVEVERFTPTRSHSNFFLIVSALEPFKKIDLAVSAFNYLGRELVIIGGGSEEARLRRMAGPTVKILGRKSDQEVKLYLESCRGFIFSGEEDFGIAPVEAMACGKPVLAYRKGGLLETMVEGVTGEFFNEQTTESLLSGLARLLVNEPTYDYRKIRKQAEKFSRSIFERKIKKIVYENH